MTPAELAAQAALKKIVCSGEMYNDYSEACHLARVAAAKKVNAYHGATSEQEKQQVMNELFAKVGKNVAISSGFRCEFGFNISLGDNVFINWDCIMLDCNEISIGSNVLFGPRVGLFGANHAIDAAERNMGGCCALPIRIGDNVWVGGNVSINPGVSIGDNTIIGAGSVVTKDIPANVIAAGVPCKVIRPITEADKTGYFADTKPLGTWE